VWKRALVSGRCPFANCDISKKTCDHLDRHLAYGESQYTPQVPVNYTDQIERYAELDLDKRDVWGMFKKLRKCGLDRDQIGVLIRVFCFDMTQRQILEDMHWTSFGMLQRRYKSALRQLQKRMGESK
jgi:diphthamide synthase subunit DPH2